MDSGPARGSTSAAAAAAATGVSQSLSLQFSLHSQRAKRCRFVTSSPFEPHQAKGRLCVGKIFIQVFGATSRAACRVTHDGGFIAPA